MTPTVTVTVDRFKGARALLVLLVGSVAHADARLERADSHVPGGPGVALFVREVRPRDGGTGVPVLLVHGARASGLASFDLPVAGGSLAGDLAEAGHRVYVVDLRGYGDSTRPPGMDAPPDGKDPLVRSDEAVRDLAAVVDWIGARTGGKQIAILGWATGGHWAGMYASLYPERVSHLVMLNSLYGGTSPHPIFTKETGPPRTAYSLATAEGLLAPWDRSIPGADKSAWRDPAVAEMYVKTALASDPTSRKRSPPSLRAPSGAIEDSYYQATGRQLWDASLVRAATLVVRSELDFWSRPEDADRLMAHLVHARRVQRLDLPGATHHVLLDRPAHGRAVLLAAVVAFLAAP